MIALHRQGVSESVDVRRRELAIAGRSAAGFDEALRFGKRIFEIVTSMSGNSVCRTERTAPIVSRWSVACCTYPSPPIRTDEVVESIFPDLDFITGMQNNCVDAIAIDVRTVEATEIHELPISTGPFECSVLSRHGDVVKKD